MAIMGNAARRGERKDSRNLPAVAPMQNLPAPKQNLPGLIAELPVDQHPLAVYAAGLPSINSQRGARLGARRALAVLLEQPLEAIGPEHLKRFAWAKLRYQHVQAIRARLLEGAVKPATINVTLSHVRGILREAWKLGYMKAEELERIRLVKNVQFKTLPAGRSLTREEIAALYRVCAASPPTQGARDAALFTVLYVGGLRRSELCQLVLADYKENESGSIRVVGGKGRKDRMVYLTDAGAREAVAAWLAYRGAWAGALFAPVSKSDRVLQHQLTPQAVREICKRRAVEAGIENFTPHDLRRTFIGDLLDGGADIGAVKGLAGHARADTTLNYDRRPEEVKKQAAALLRVPYLKPREERK